MRFAEAEDGDSHPMTTPARKLELPDILADAFWTRFNGYIRCEGPDHQLWLHLYGGEVRWASAVEAEFGPLDLAPDDPAIVESQVIDAFSWRDATFAREPAQLTPPTTAINLPFHRLLARGIASVQDPTVLENAAGALDARVAAIPNVALESVRDLSDDTCALLGTIRRGFREPGDPAPRDRVRLLQCLWELRLLGLVTDSAAEGAKLSDLISNYVGSCPTTPMPRPEPPRPAATPEAIPIASEPVTPVKPTIPPVVAAPRLTVVVESTAAPAFKLDQKSLSTEARVEGAESAAEWCGAGDTFARELDPYRAITSYREAVRIAPANVEYRLKLATALARNPKWRKEAEDELLHAAELSPWDPRIQVALGRIYKEARLLGRAKARFQSALEMDPEHAPAKRELKNLTDGDDKAGEAGAKMSFLAKLKSMAQKPVGAAGDGKKTEVEEEVIAGD